MPRLIDADALNEKLEALMQRYTAQGRKEVAEDYNFVMTVLMTAPTIDATIFPCKIGDTVWFVPDNRNRRNIIETTVEKLVLKSGGIYMKLSCNAMYETSCRSIGKTVFFNREEAERRSNALD